MHPLFQNCKHLPYKYHSHTHAEGAHKHNRSTSANKNMKSSSILTPSISYLLLLVVSMGATVVLSQPRHPTCPSKCGNYNIDYPFGIGSPECYLTGFQIQCISNTVHTVPVLADANLTIDQFLMSKGQVVLRVPQLMAFHCPNQSFGPNRSEFCLSLPHPFTVSARSNKFVALGCDTLAVLNNNGTFKSSCQTLWSRGRGSTDRGGGLGNCQIALPEGNAGFCYSVSTMNNYEDCAAATKCGFAAVVEAGARYPNESVLVAMMRAEAEPQLLVADWAVVGSRNPCGQNSVFNIANRGWGYLCRCVEGFTGNPYLNGAGSCTNNGLHFSSDKAYANFC